MKHHSQQGVTLIETLIGMTLLVILIKIAAPSYITWITNNKVRASAESILNGLQLARTEAMKRNTTVRFQLVSDLTSACTVSSSGTNWVVSQENAASKCNIAPSDTTSPKTIQARSAAEGSSGISVAATLSGGSNASVVFDSFGRVQLSSLGSTISSIYIKPSGASNGTYRDMKIVVNAGGTVMMCDPAVTTTGDPRKCP